MTTLWKIAQGKLLKIAPTTLSAEQRLEEWLASDLSILGLDVMLVGRQVQTAFGGRIDLLATDRDGDLLLIELKRNMTPREIVAQILDYASWVAKLTTKDVHEIAQSYLKRPLATAFKEEFDAQLPETLNSSHSLIIVAGALDPSSQRIVEYLADECGVRINTAFFNFFSDGGQEYLAADWLMDQEEIEQRAASNKKAPWTGFWYVNVGDGPDRSWEDMRKYGFITAGGGRIYSGKLNLLQSGDPVFAYQKNAGYVGYGIVMEPSMPAKAFEVDGQTLPSLPMKIPLTYDKENPEIADYAVGVEWKKTFPISDAIRFDGMFANQNIVCRLRDAPTLEHLKVAFDVNA